MCSYWWWYKLSVKLLMQVWAGINEDRKLTRESDCWFGAVGLNWVTRCLRSTYQLCWPLSWIIEAILISFSHSHMRAVHRRWLSMLTVPSLWLFSIRNSLRDLMHIPFGTSKSSFLTCIWSPTTLYFCLSCYSLKFVRLYSLFHYLVSFMFCSHENP